MTATPLFSFGQVALLLSLLGSVSKESLNAEQANSRYTLTVRVKARDEIHPPSPLRVSTDKQTCGESRSPQTVVIDRDRNLKNAIVWLEGRSVNPWPARDPKDIPAQAILEEGCEFNPRIVITPPEGVVSLFNRDNVLHGVRTKGQSNPPINRVHPPNLNKVDLKLPKIEIVPIVCDFHPWEKAFVVVAPHSHYAITDSSGQAVFRDVAPGSYKVKLWHEILGSLTLPDDAVVSNRSLVITVPWGLN